MHVADTVATVHCGFDLTQSHKSNVSGPEGRSSVSGRAPN